MLDEAWRFAGGDPPACLRMLRDEPGVAVGAAAEAADATGAEQPRAQRLAGPVREERSGDRRNRDGRQQQAEAPDERRPHDEHDRPDRRGRTQDHRDVQEQRMRRQVALDLESLHGQQDEAREEQPEQ